MEMYENRCSLRNIFSFKSLILHLNTPDIPGTCVYKIPSFSEREYVKE